MAIGMAVIATTVIGRGATIAVIAGRVAATMTGMAAAMAVVVTTTRITMTDCDLPSLLGLVHSGLGTFDNGAPWRPVVLSGLGPVQ